MRTSFVLLFALIFGTAVFGDIPHPLSLAAAFIIHEGGHIVAAKLLHVKLQSVRGGFCGIRMRYDFSGVTQGREIAVCMAGSFFGILSAVVGAVLGIASRDWGMYFLLSSASLSAVNMLPIRGLDGGSILICILETNFLPETAWSISKKISAVTSMIFWVASLWIQLRVGVNLSMLLLSLYFLYLSVFEN